MDRTLLGGTPEEVPERFEASSPLTYVDEVRAPVYISAGVNDPRCPIRQIDNYVTAWRPAARSTRSTATTPATAPWWWTSGSSRSGWNWTSRRGT